MAKPLQWSEWQDAIITKMYSTQSYAERRRLHEKHMASLAPRNRSQVYQRALKLGVIKPLKRQGDWTAAEDEILERNAHKHVATIQKILSQHGFSRTRVAIDIRRKRDFGGYRQAKQDAGIYTANQAGEIIGASSRCVTLHIEAGRLKAKRGANHGPNVVWEIQASDLRKFVIENTAYCDFSRVDKYALVDLLCPNHGSKAAKEAA